MSLPNTMRMLAVAPLAIIAIACASVPVEVERARESYEAAASDPSVADHASVELYEASKTIDKADNAWDENEEESLHLAYVAQRQIEIARAAATRKRAEAEVTRLGEERERVILEARTSEAEKQRLLAEAKALEAEMAAAEARAARERVEKLEAEIEELGAKRSERGLVLTLGDVLFDTGKAELRPGALRNLYGLVTFLRENPDRNVIIEGHTDSTGDDAFNAALSRRRAQSVKDFLVENALEPSRLVVSGYGEDYPVASNDNASGRQQNRRVEVVILDPGAKPGDHLRPPGVGSGGRY